MTHDQIKDSIFAKVDLAAANAPSKLVNMKRWAICGLGAKVPWTVQGGKLRKGGHTLEENLLTLADAVARIKHIIERTKGPTDGTEFQLDIGLNYIFFPQDPFKFIDFDHIYDIETRKILPKKQWLLDWLRKFDSYAEHSMNDGAHVIIEAPEPIKKCKYGATGMECYPMSGVRPMRFTGDLIGGEIRDVEPRQEAFSEFIAELLAKEPKRVGQVYTPPATASTPITVEKHEAINWAEKYLAASGGAVSDQKGHDKTYFLAQEMIWGFALEPHEAKPLLMAWNHTCTPPWSEKEIDHKISQALNRPRDKPRGYLLETKTPTTKHTMQPGTNVDGVMQEMKGIEMISTKVDTETGPEIKMTDQEKARIKIEAEAERQVTELINENRTQSQTGGKIKFGLIKPTKEALQEIIDTAPNRFKQIYRYHCERNNVDVQSLSFAASLSLASSVLCESLVAVDNWATPSLYILGLALSGAGKDCARKVNRQILSASEVNSLKYSQGTKWTSDSAIYTTLENYRAPVVMVDEFGDFLSRVSDKNAPGWVRSINECLKEVYTSGSTSGIIFKQFSMSGIPQDKRLQLLEDARIDYPMLNLYATATPDAWGNVTVDQVKNGLMGRLLVFQEPSIYQYPREDYKPNFDIPESILKWVNRWIEFKPHSAIGRQNIAEESQNPMLFNVTKSPEVIEYERVMIRKLVDQANAMQESQSGISAMIKRCDGLITQVALVARCLDFLPPAVDKSPPEPANNGEEGVNLIRQYLGEPFNGLQVDLKHYKWAELVVQFANGVKCQEVFHNVAESVSEHQINRVRRAIMRAGAKGIIKGQLSRNTKGIEGQDRDKAIRALIERMEITSTQTASGGTLYTII